MLPLLLKNRNRNGIWRSACGPFHSLRITDFFIGENKRDLKPIRPKGIMGYTFGKATRKDIKKLIFKHYKNKRMAKNRAECYVSHNFTTVARQNREIIGRVQWYIKENPSHGLVEFEEVYLSEKHRGKGIGKALLKNAIKDVREHFKKEKLKLRRIYLFVSKDNMTARRLYKGLGFREVADVGDLFYDGCKELLCVLRV
jgi:ribosomal protein S18 acetylase RimI-like enzyme